MPISRLSIPDHSTILSFFNSFYSNSTKRYQLPLCIAPQYEPNLFSPFLEYITLQKFVIHYGLCEVLTVLTYLL